jgi:hypothetical protein
MSALNHQCSIYDFEFMLGHITQWYETRVPELDSDEVVLIRKMPEPAETEIEKDYQNEY